MQLLDVYSPTTDYRDAVRFLYQMLKDRDPIVSISHKSMPTFEQHRAFVESHPYETWYIIEDDTRSRRTKEMQYKSWIGNCYLTKANEIGIFILPEYQGHGSGPLAVGEIMRLHGPGRYLANIAPMNKRSQKCFERLGFVLCQYTYEFEHAEN